MHLSIHEITLTNKCWAATLVGISENNCFRLAFHLDGATNYMQVVESFLFPKYWWKIVIRKIGSTYKLFDTNYDSSQTLDIIIASAEIMHDSIMILLKHEKY